MIVMVMFVMMVTMMMMLGPHKPQLGQRGWLMLLPSRWQALLQLWMLWARCRSRVPLKLKSLQMTLRQSMSGMPMTLNRSSQELQSWWWPAPCKLTRHVSPPLPLHDDDRDGDVYDGHGDDALCGWLMLLLSRLQALLRLWLP